MSVSVLQILPWWLQRRNNVLQIYAGWVLTRSVLHECRQQHIVDVCSLTKFEGILQSVHKVFRDALNCMEITVTTALWMQAWVPAGATGWRHLPLSLPLEMLRSGFLKQMLSKTSADKSIYASFWENIVSFLGFVPRPLPGSCSWTLLGDFHPSDPLTAHPWKKSCGRPWMQVLVCVYYLV